MRGHKERLIEYLEKNGSITSMEAITELGNTRLSATIYNLRKEGYNIVNERIKSKNRFGNKVHYDKYILVKGE